jgi:hypothetical protein
MSRRVLGWCLLAYPRVDRCRDGDYLLDLALDLAGRQGLARQVVSLVAGGLRQRVARAGKRTWRIAAASLAGAALAFAALTAAAPGNHQVDRFACAASVAGASRGCAGASRLVAARERAGWQCVAPLLTGRAADWECVRDH